MESARKCVACGTTYAGDERFCSKCGGNVDDDIVGATIDGRYRVVRLLGRGGMGAVYEAEHAALDRRVAIKVLTGGRDDEALARFRREARAASKISDPHVVQIFDVGTWDGRDYIAMEYVEGKDLRGVMEHGPLEVGRAVAIARQMLAALAAIHEAGIVHRDIKPANVLVRAGDAVKVMDFGIAKATQNNVDPTLTKENQVLGTPHFMAPEQVAGEAVDLRADLYAVGVTLYAMLAGVVPFDGNSFTQIAMQHLTEPPPRLADKRPDTPGHVVAAVERALAKDPAARFASATAFAAALAGTDNLATVVATRLAGTNPAEAATVAAPTTARRELPRRKIGLYVALAALVLSGIVTVTVVLAGHAPDSSGRPVVSADASGESLAQARHEAEHEAQVRKELEARIAKLEAGSGPNAGSGSSSGSAATSARPPAEARGAKPEARRCMCFIEGQSACPKATAPSCRCQLEAGVYVCFDPWVACKQGECSDYTCPRERAAGAAGAACSGYYGGSPPTNATRSGTYDCDYCPGTPPAALRVYHGPDGVPCDAIDRTTGKPARGETGACE